MTESEPRPEPASAEPEQGLPRADPVIAPIFRQPPPQPVPGPNAATPPNPPVERPISRVYDHLVEGDDDVIGLIAYALYKRDKREWHMTWRERHTAEPTPRELEAFINSMMTSGQRERYRTAARAALDAYASVALDLEKPEIVKEAIAGRVETAARRMERRSHWYRAIPGAFLGALLFVLVAAAAIAILVALDVDILGYLSLEPVDAAVDALPSADAPAPAVETPVFEPTPADPAPGNGAG